VLWDFDGTLAYREGMWTGTLIEILRAEEPHLQPTRDELRPYLTYPWHSPNVPHPEIIDAEAWWAQLLPFFECAFLSLDLSAERATQLASLVRAQYCDLGNWKLFDDTLSALNGFACRGWTQAILSNHVPELASIVEGLGIASFFEDIHTSAETGYEKPHAEAFSIGLQTLPDASQVWMIGDNPVADIRGAEQVGIPAILVRRSDATVQLQCENLTQVQNMIESADDP